MAGMNAYLRLAQKLGYEWQDFDTLLLAFRHSSWANEQAPKAEPNERLEFLGDATLDLLSAEFLMAMMPDAREGVLSQARAQLVRASNLAARAKALGLGDLLMLGKGADYLREVESVLADTMEAVIGSAYRDGGIIAARVVAHHAGITVYN